MCSNPDGDWKPTRFPVLDMQTFMRLSPLPELRVVSHEVDAFVGKQKKRLRSALAAAFYSFRAVIVTYSRSGARKLRSVRRRGFLAHDRTRKLRTTISVIASCNPAPAIRSQIRRVWQALALV